MAGTTVDRTSTGKQAISVVGLSELVKNTEAIFLEEIDRIEVLDPADTKLVADKSTCYTLHCIKMQFL